MQVLFLTVSCFFHFPVIIESVQAIAMPGLHVPPTSKLASFSQSSRGAPSAPLQK